MHATKYARSLMLLCRSKEMVELGSKSVMLLIDAA